MRLKAILFTLAAMCGCAAAFASQSSFHEYGKNAIDRLFLDAHNPDQPPKYSRSEIKRMIRDAKTPRDFERLADYFDYQSMEFDQKADQQVKELERLLALPFRARSYPTQVEITREFIKKYRLKADECDRQATAYHVQANSAIHD
jgi:hypothetical protein